MSLFNSNANGYIFSDELKTKVRKSLDYQGIPRRNVNESSDIAYSKDIDIIAVSMGCSVAIVACKDCNVLHGQSNCGPAIGRMRFITALTKKTNYVMSEYMKEFVDDHISNGYWMENEATRRVDYVASCAYAIGYNLYTWNTGAKKYGDDQNWQQKIDKTVNSMSQECKEEIKTSMMSAYEKKLF